MLLVAHKILGQNGDNDMKKNEISWIYGENNYQKYYEAYIGKDYLCVFSNKWNPDIWMGMCCGKTILNKTKNDRQRKKQNLDKHCPVNVLRTITVLTSMSPEYMMKKVAWCYKHNLSEISQ